MATFTHPSKGRRPWWKRCCAGFIKALFWLKQSKRSPTTSLKCLKSPISGNHCCTEARYISPNRCVYTEKDTRYHRNWSRRPLMMIISNNPAQNQYFLTDSLPTRSIDKINDVRTVALWRLRGIAHNWGNCSAFVCSLSPEAGSSSCCLGRTAEAQRRDRCEVFHIIKPHSLIIRMLPSLKFIFINTAKYRFQFNLTLINDKGKLFRAATAQEIHIWTFLLLHFELNN